MLYARTFKKKISIHAPLAGRDLCGIEIHQVFLDISIHAPLAGRDLQW